MLNATSNRWRIDTVTWEDSGSDDDPKSRLLAQVAILGCPMHLEAYAVHYDGDAHMQVPDDISWDVTINDFASAAGSDGPWMTVGIDGREYVLFASPHCQ